MLKKKLKYFNAAKRKLEMKTGNKYIFHCNDGREIVEMFSRSQTRLKKLAILLTHMHPRTLDTPKTVETCK